MTPYSRRQAALALRDSGATLREIGKQCGGVSATRAASLVKRAQWERDSASMATKFKAMVGIGDIRGLDGLAGVSFLQCAQSLTRNLGTADIDVVRAVLARIVSDTSIDMQPAISRAMGRVARADEEARRQARRDERARRRAEQAAWMAGRPLNPTWDGSIA